MTFHKTSYLRAGLAAASKSAIGSHALSGPCDIYAAGRTPCVAAVGTTRALYGLYSGPLYQL
jgi:non-reducing end alpha-L-arabinofuranosidase